MLQETLKVVPEPVVVTAAGNAPPVLEGRKPTVEYTCGKCGAVLMRVNRAKGRRILIVHCTSCGSYNSTEDD
jgi:DNA-directed RNA polymerase subunit RPC12/RpoP